MMKAEDFLKREKKKDAHRSKCSLRVLKLEDFLNWGETLEGSFLKNSLIVCAEGRKLSKQRGMKNIVSSID